MREETDYSECQEYCKNDPYLEIEPWSRSIDHLRLVVNGLENTPYEGGRYVFEIKLPSNYPFYPPYVYCFTLIWHPNVDSTIPPGKLNMSLVYLIDPEFVGKKNPDTGESGWTPSKTLVDLIKVLKGLIHLIRPYVKPGCALNSEAGEQYLNNRSLFDKIAKEWTEKYAMD